MYEQKWKRLLQLKIKIQELEEMNLTMTKKKRELIKKTRVVADQLRVLKQQLLDEIN